MIFPPMEVMTFTAPDDKAEVFEVSTDFRFSAYLLDDVFFALCGK